MSIPARFAVIASCVILSAACDAQPSPDDVIRLRPAVGPITAVFNAGSQSTTYSAVVHNNEVFAINVLVRWSGTNCGETTAAERTLRLEPGYNTQTASFTWTHPHPPCGASPAHDDATIQMTASWNGGTATCSYRGAAAGTGANCQ